MENRTHRPCGGTPRRGLTLIELLLVISVLGLLSAILIPALSSGRHAAMDLKCRSGLRTITTSFMDFASESGAGRRGDSDQFAAGQFRLEDFQESIYQVDEFWNDPTEDRVTIDSRTLPLACPASPATLERRSGVPCSRGAVGPRKNISVGFNRRLDTTTRFIDDRAFPQNAYVTEKILNYADVPLVFDVDGEKSAANNVIPYYSAPPLARQDIPDIYSSGRYWIPSFRHRGSMNVAFIGGHVLSSRQPTQEPWWRWDYEPEM
ncbi:MAG TPA: type II secretion system protein [Phycisphaerae bacterium]|nr:type II secretion system protein [Phycisphaerae bacterium]